MSSSKKHLIALYVFLALAMGLYIGNRFFPHENTANDGIRSFGLRKLSEIVKYVEHEYVDTINIQLLEEKIIRSFLEQLDPHSEYISASEFDEVNDPLFGSFDGIGVQFNIQRDTVVVIQPVVGGPSEKVGIRSGDRIVEVDGRNIAGIGISNQEVMKALKGPRNTRVQVGVFRRSASGILSFIIVRDEIPSNSIDVAMMINKSTAYIRISRFSAKTGTEFVEALSLLQTQGMQELIIDLRGNGGGVLQSAVEMGDQVLPPGDTIVYTQGRNRPRQVFTARRNGRFETQKLVVLIDEFSASASEIIAGAVQDNDRGLIIGRRSFGKGLVQEQVRMKDGSAIRITVARYYTPSGRCIQSDYVDGTDKYMERFINRVLDPKAEVNGKDTLTYYTTGGRKVFGGGGIMPDIVIKYDTLEMSSWYVQLINKGLLNSYALDYADMHRRRLQNLGLTRPFRLSENDFRNFLEWCKKKDIYPDEAGLTASKEIVKNRLESLIVRNVFGEKAFYLYFLKYDSVVQRALEELGRMK